MREFSINPINFNLTTCYDPKNTRSKKLIEINLEQFRKTHFSINFNFSLEEDKYYHDRYINVDNKYLIDLTRGLDIFENYNNPYNTITKKCTVFITRIK